MNANREFAELVGIEPELVNLFNNIIEEYEVESVYPDFAADPRLVLREMDRISKLHAFLVWLLSADTEGVPLVANCLIKYRYILDTTGLLLEKAINFLKKKD